MTLADLETAFAGFLVDRTLAEVYRIVVHTPGDTFELNQTMLLVLDDGSAAQITTDGHEQSFRTLKSINDYKVPGDYDDRTSAVLKAVSCASVPCEVRGIHMAYDSDLSAGIDYPVGLFLVGLGGQVSLSVQFHLDDVELGPPEMLWNYLNAIVDQTSCLTVRKI